MNKIRKSVESLIKGFSSGSMNLFIILVIFYVLINILTMKTYIIEIYYSRLIFKYISAFLNTISSYLPISLAEISLLIFIIFIVISIIRFIIGIIKSLFDKQAAFFLGASLYKLMCFTLIIYTCFMLLWGLNYYRKPLLSYMPHIEMTDENVAIVVNMLIEEANVLRNDIEINYESYDLNRFINLSKNINLFFKPIYDEFSFLEGFVYSNPKPILMSKLFLYTKISGIYSPFTGEANVNYMVPPLTITFTMLHEMAHQRGIAYEDEANFLAYVANYKSENKHMQYAAAFEALLYCLNSLDKGELYTSLVGKIDKNVIEDIKYVSNFWSDYDGYISEAANTVNDVYLKSNSQELGVKSYSKVVNLIVAYRLYSEK